MSAWKVFAHDRRSPIQRGDVVWDGSFPFELPKVKLDRSSADCGAGWNYCPRLGDALRIAGLWPTGRPSLVVAVDPVGSPVARGDKSRAAALILKREATASEIEAGIREFSVAFGDHADAMVAEQLAWRHALARPTRDEALIHGGLTAGLAARGLDWKIRRFSTATAAWDAWDARDARDARPAWDARDALTISFAARQGWVPSSDLFGGIRDAYAAGLEVAIPTGPKELGWAMAEQLR